MGTTGITVDQNTAMMLRQVKQDMSRAEGRVVPMAQVLRRLVDSWRNGDQDELADPCPECQSRLAYSHGETCSRR